MPPGPPPPHRRAWVIYWRIVNPLGRLAAGYLPWWVLIETTGRKSHRPRRTPLALGPKNSSELWLIAVHGRHSVWVRNIEAQPEVRVQHMGKWRSGTASIESVDDGALSRFNAYARSGLRIAGYEPVLVRVSSPDHRACPPSPGGRQDSTAPPNFGSITSRRLMTL
jgi:deazaflavin-dependent oxidoreductase (nitroreductase family)